MADTFGRIDGIGEDTGTRPVRRFGGGMPGARPGGRGSQRIAPMSLPGGPPDPRRAFTNVDPSTAGPGMVPPPQPGGGWQARPNVGTWQPGQGAPPWAQGGGQGGPGAIPGAAPGGTGGSQQVIAPPAPPVAVPPVQQPQAVPPVSPGVAPIGTGGGGQTLATGNQAAPVNPGMPAKPVIPGRPGMMNQPLNYAAGLGGFQR